jgi:hypothetical protein
MFDNENAERKDGFPMGNDRPTEDLIPVIHSAGADVLCGAMFRACS